MNIYLLILSSKIKCISKLELSTQVQARCRQDPARKKLLGPIVTRIRSGGDATTRSLKALESGSGEKMSREGRRAMMIKVMWAPPYAENTK
jgi:hypothetical protein